MSDSKLHDLEEKRRKSMEEQTDLRKEIDEEKKSMEEEIDKIRNIHQRKIDEKERIYNVSQQNLKNTESEIKREEEKLRRELSGR